jgi:hypothetical protein
MEVSRNSYILYKIARKCKNTKKKISMTSNNCNNCVSLLLIFRFNQWQHSAMIKDNLKIRNCTIYPNSGMSTVIYVGDSFIGN